jgi:hypothetical protein
MMMRTNLGTCCTDRGIVNRPTWAESGEISPRTGTDWLCVPSRRMISGRVQTAGTAFHRQGFDASAAGSEVSKDE